MRPCSMRWGWLCRWWRCRRWRDGGACCRGGLRCGPDGTKAELPALERSDAGRWMAGGCGTMGSGWCSSGSILLAIRWMHWINFPVLFTMMWSGLLISTGTTRFRRAIMRMRCTGWVIGHWTLFRFFPAWVLYEPGSGMSGYKVTQALGYHFFFMWIFAINGILYAAYLLCFRRSGSLWCRIRSRSRRRSR